MTFTPAAAATDSFVVVHERQILTKDRVTVKIQLIDRKPYMESLEGAVERWEVRAQKVSGVSEVLPDEPFYAVYDDVRDAVYLFNEVTGVPFDEEEFEALIARYEATTNAKNTTRH